MPKTLQLVALEIVMGAAAQTIGSMTVLLVNATKTIPEEEALDEEKETVEEAVVVAETLAEVALTAKMSKLVDATTTMATNLPNLGAPPLLLLVSPQPKLSTVVLSIGVASVFNGQLHTPLTHTLAQIDLCPIRTLPLHHQIRP